MIPITKPWLGEAERQAVLGPLKSGWLMQGPRVRQFEEEVALYTGREHAVAVSSGTAAVHTALLAAGVGPGQSVALRSFTFIACANAVALCGATPVFIDVDPRTFNLDPDDLRRRGKGVDALLTVHQFGRASEFAEVAAELGVDCVVEDAACALGTRLPSGRHVGSKSAAATLSFHPRKIVTTGEGGMVLTDDDEVAATVRALRNHGGEGGGHRRLGLNYRLTDMQAAIGTAQLDRLEGALQAERYVEGLSACSWLTLPSSPPAGRHAWQSYVGLVDDESRDRDEVLVELERRGVSARPGATACHVVGWCAQASKMQPEDLPGALLAHRRSLALPIFPGLTPDNQQTVIAAILSL